MNEIEHRRLALGLAAVGVGLIAILGLLCWKDLYAEYWLRKLDRGGRVEQLHSLEVLLNLECAKTNRKAVAKALEVLGRECATGEMPLPREDLRYPVLGSYIRAFPRRVEGALNRAINDERLGVRLAVACVIGCAVWDDSEIRRLDAGKLNAESEKERDMQLLGGQVPLLPMLARMLADEDKNVRRYAMLTLSMVGPGGLALIDRGISDPDPGVRGYAVLALESNGLRGTKKYVPALLGLLSDQDVAVRLAALEALSVVGAGRPDVADSIADLLKNDKLSFTMRTRAIASLGDLEIATPKVLTALEDAARSGDQAIRTVAIRSLQKIAESDGGGMEDLKAE